MKSTVSTDTCLERKIIYFEDLRPENRPKNTDITLQLAKERAKATNIKKIVLASTFGDTANKALEYFKDTDIQLIVVSHQFDFRKKEGHRFPKELITKLRQAGHEVHFATMLFHTDKLYGSSAPTAIANILYSFSQGVKVCMEIAYMVTDAGYLQTGETAIIIAGTGLGADTALIMQGGSTQNPSNLRVNEILCKPLNLAPTE